MIQSLSEKIKEYISDRHYVPMKYEQLCDTFAEECSPSEFAQAMAELEKDAVIIYLKKGKIASAENAGYVRGTFRSNAKGFGFFVPDEEFRRRCGGDLYIAEENTMGAIQDDVVLAAILYEARPGDTKGGEGKIVRIIEHRLKTVIGSVKTIAALAKRRTPRYYVKVDDRHIDFTVMIEPDKLMNAQVGSKVEVEIESYPTEMTHATGKVIRVFGDSQSSEANYAAILYENGIKTAFDSETLEQAEKSAAQPFEALCTGRENLRDSLILTIDGADAKDLDDAISVARTERGFLLGVHIADVAEYVHENTALDNEAMERGTSVYFADQVVPMLPQCISNGVCSLNADTDKLTLSALMELNMEGEIIDFSIKETVIRSKIRGVYSEINDVIRHGRDSAFYDKYKILGGMLDDMLALYHILEKSSRERGALDLESNESKIIIESGVPVDIVKRERGISERLIEQFMLCANEAVASWLFWQDMPCVYRIHDRPSPEKIQIFSLFAHNAGLNTAPLRSKNVHSITLGQILDQAKEKGIGNTVSYMLLRSMMKAKYSASCSQHFGLAIDKYCHFTSPIRRYPDLSVHRIIKVVLHGEMENGTRYAHFMDFAQRSAEKSSQNELKAISAERDIEDLYKVVFMQDKEGEEFEGTIVSVTAFGMFVELENTCEGLVPISSLDGYFEYDEKSMTLSRGYKTYALGQKVNVRIEKVDIISRKIEMSIVGASN